MRSRWPARADWSDGRLEARRIRRESWNAGDTVVPPRRRRRCQGLAKRPRPLCALCPPRVLRRRLAGRSSRRGLHSWDSRRTRRGPARSAASATAGSSRSASSPASSSSAPSSPSALARRYAASAPTTSSCRASKRPRLTAAAACPRSLARRYAAAAPGQVTLLLEQYPEVRCGRRLAALVGATKSDRGGRELSPFHK